MPGVTFREANKRYIRLFIPVMIVYALLTFVGPGLMVAFKGHPPVWAMAAISIITGAPIAGVFWLMGRYLRETDEYTRRIQVEALLTGAAITFSLAVIWGFLELYQVIPKDRIFTSMMMVGPAFFFFYGLSFFVQYLRRGGSRRDFTPPGQESP